MAPSKTRARPGILQRVGDAAFAHAPKRWPAYRPPLHRGRISARAARRARTGSRRASRRCIRPYIVQRGRESAHRYSPPYISESSVELPCIQPSRRQPDAGAATRRRRSPPSSWHCSGNAACAADLTVSAAASLTNAFKEIGAAFEAAHPGTKVRLNFAASGVLLQQIAKGAPVDVFASADQETMNQAERRAARAGRERASTSSAIRWS